MSSTFTRKEVSLIHGISVETFKYREKVLGIKPVFKKQKTKAMLYTLDQINKLVNFNKKDKEEARVPKVIYITIAPSDVYHSRMNYDKTL